MKPQPASLDYFNKIKVFGKPFPHPNASDAYFIKFRFTIENGRNFMKVLKYCYPSVYSKTRFYVTKTTNAVIVGGEYNKQHLKGDIWTKVLAYKETIV
jgi:hypothetical protein